MRKPITDPTSRPAAKKADGRPSPRPARSPATFTMSATARFLALFGALCIGVALFGCETSHTETDKPGFFGGNTHEETTTTHNPITGTDDTTHTETKTP